MDYVPTPAAAFQSSAQRISRVFACLQSSISSMHHITRSTCLGELPASLCHCASQKSCRPWSSWPACQYSAGIRSLPRRAACHLLSSRGLRPWSSCQPACILQASVRAGASCVPSPCHREIFVPGRAASLPAFCRHPFVPGRASVPSPSIARSSCLVELPACLQVCKRPFVPRRASCHLLSSRGLRACSSYKPACILHASVRDRASCVPHFCHRASQSLRASSSCPACLHSAGISSCRASCVPSPVIARCFVPGRAASLPCILQATGWCWGELRAISYHREIFVPGRAASLPAFCSIRSCCGELRARILPSRIARSLCLVELPACLHSAGHPFVPGRAACLNPAIAHRKVSVPGRASSLPAFCRHPFVPWRAACQILPIAHRKVSVPGRAASLPAFCRHPFVPGRAACQNPAIAHSKISAPGQAASLPAFCRHPLVLWRAACQNPAIAHRKISVPGQAASLPAFCRHPFALGQTAWQTPAIAHRKVLRAWSSCQPACILQASVRARASCVPSPVIARSSYLVELSACLHSAVIRSCCGELRARLLPSRIAKSPCLVKLPACLHSAGIRSCCGELRARLLPSRIARSPCLVKLPACLHSAGIRSCCGERRARILPSRIARSPCLVELPACLQTPAITHRKVSMPGRAASLPAFCRHPFVPGRAACQNPAIAHRKISVPGQAASLPAFCRHPFALGQTAWQTPAIAHRKVSVPGRAASLPAFCRHPFVPGRAACHHLSSRDLRIWSSCQPACILQSSIRAGASVVPSPIIARSSCLVELPACLHSAGIRSCQGELRAITCHREDLRIWFELSACLHSCSHPLVLWRAACQTPAITHRKVSVHWSSYQPACILQASARAVASCVPESCHRASHGLHAWSSCQPACRLLPSRIAKSPCLVKLPACLHSAGIRSCCGELRARLLPSRIARSHMPGRAASLPADSCHHASQNLRAWSSCQPACILQASARAVASCVPESCHRASQDLRAWSAASLPAFCRHPFALGQTAWQTPAIAHRKVSVPGRAASLPAFCRHPFVPGRAACHHLSSRDLRIWSSCQPACILQSSARAVVSCVPDSCHHASQSLRAWSSYQPACILQGIRSCCGELRAITCHREIFVSGRAVSLPAFCSHPSVPGRASCHLLSSRGLRAWSSCQPACIFAGIRSQPGRAACQNPAIAHRKISVPGQAVSLPAFCRHPFVPWRAACQTPAIAHRKIFRAWSSFQPACILQASVRARASCVPESCHRAS
ncbi:uncharacterized protein [Maniola hyperantus]|uniref:uncharacterized protein isoform X5 n=1 Tax=Aphantopus hyperantus TaxID=2795564 RepID=UPI00374A1E54